MDTDYLDLMAEAIASLGWDGKANLQPERNLANGSRWARGRGMALSLRHGSQGGGRAYALVTMDARGVVTIQHNAPEIGQGTHNLFSVVAAQTLGIPQQQIQVRAPDTAVSLPFAGVSAQRTTMQMGNAVHNACQKLKQELFTAASQAKGGKPEEWQLIEGRLCWREASFSVSEIIRLIGGGVVLKPVDYNSVRPMVKMSLFGERVFSGGLVALMMWGFGLFGIYFFTSLYLQGVLGFTAFEAGIAFFPMTVVNFVVAMTIPRLTAKCGHALPLTAGVALTLGGMAWLAQVQVDSSYWTAVAMPMMLIGAGQGLAFAPLTSAGLAGVDSAHAGAASGLVNTFHQLGMALGLGILVTVSVGAGRAAQGDAARLTTQIHAALTAGTALLAGCLIVVTLIASVHVISARQPVRGSGQLAPATN